MAPSVHIDQGFAQNICDIVCQIPFRDTRRGVKTVALVLEHKAQSGGFHDKRLATQLTRYAIDESERVAKETPDQLETPQAIVIVVYTGRDEFFRPRPWSDFYKPIEFCKNSAISPEFPCFNLTKLFLEGKLIGPPHIVAFATSMACAGKRKIREYRDKILAAFRTVKRFDAKVWGRLKAIALYASMVSENSKERLTEQEVEELLESASENDGVRKELRMSFFDRIRAEAEARAEARGEARGEAKGEAKRLLKCVAIQYGQIAEPIDKAIRSIDDESVLDKITELLFKTKSRAKFEQGVAQLLPAAAR